MEEIKNNDSKEQNGGGEMTEQVKTAIKKMKDSGFKRNEFQCQVEKEKDGSYGKADITVRNSDKITQNEKMVLANELGIIRVILNDEKIHDTITTKNNYEGKLRVLDYRTNK